MEVYRDGARRLLDALASADPDASCWRFGQGPRTVAFWYRRQTHETTVHRWDAQISIGATTPISPLVAADGVDEALTVMLPIRHKWRTTPLPQLIEPLRVTATDTGHSWLLGPGLEQAISVLDGDHPAAQRDPIGVLRGSAEALLLLLWGRQNVSESPVLIDGDRTTVAAFVTAGITP